MAVIPQLWRPQIIGFTDFLQKANEFYFVGGVYTRLGRNESYLLQMTTDPGTNLVAFAMSFSVGTDQTLQITVKENPESFTQGETEIQGNTLDRRVPGQRPLLTVKESPSNVVGGTVLLDTLVFAVNNRTIGEYLSLMDWVLPIGANYIVEIKNASNKNTDFSWGLQWRVFRKDKRAKY